MSGFYSGQHGQLEIDGTKAAKVINWAYSVSMNTLPTTTLEDRDSTHTTGVRDHTGSAELFYYASTGSTPTNSASTVLNKIIKRATTGDQGVDPDEVTIKLIIDDGTTNKKYIKGKAHITTAAMTMAVGEVLKAQISFKFNGAPTELLI